MRNILLSLIILISSNLFGQNNDIINSQKENFTKAEQLLKNSNGLEALFYYHQVCFPNLKTDFEYKAKQRIDSLLPIYQKMESSKWKGKWELKQLKTNLFAFEKIIITENIISFYNKVNDTIASRNEKIKHTEYEPNDFVVNINSLKFENNEIWEFSTEKTDNELKLFPNLKTESNGTTWLLLDERAMIRNDVEREKALAEEIRTYYVRIK